MQPIDLRAENRNKQQSTALRSLIGASCLAIFRRRARRCIKIAMQRFPGEAVVGAPPRQDGGSSDRRARGPENPRHAGLHGTDFAATAEAPFLLTILLTYLFIPISVAKYSAKIVRWVDLPKSMLSRMQILLVVNCPMYVNFARRAHRSRGSLLAGEFHQPRKCQILLVVNCPMHINLARGAHRSRGSLQAGEFHQPRRC